MKEGPGGRLKRFGSAIPVAVIVVATLQGSCSRSHGDADANPPRVVRFQTLSGQAKTIDLSRLSARLTVFVLFSPGFHCSSCLRSLDNWDVGLAGWPEGRVEGFIVGEGGRVDLPGLRLFQRARGVRTQVLMDTRRDLRRLLHLSQGALAVGLNRQGEIVFQLPIDGPARAGPDGREWIESLLSALLSNS